LDDNGQISINGVFALIDTIFDKFFVDKNGFVNQLLAGTQEHVKGHPHHNRARAHVPFGSVRVKRDDELPGFIPGIKFGGFFKTPMWQNSAWLKLVYPLDFTGRLTCGFFY
jgi:hypothetical protein